MAQSIKRSSLYHVKGTIHNEENRYIYAPKNTAVTLRKQKSQEIGREKHSNTNFKIISPSLREQVNKNKYEMI